MHRACLSMVLINHSVLSSDAATEKTQAGESQEALDEKGDRKDPGKAL